MKSLLDNLIWVEIVGLDVVAAILGIVAGVSQNRVCSEPSQKAFSLGLGALVILGLAQFLDIFRRCRISSQDEVHSFSKKYTYAYLFVIWILYFGASVALLFGLMANRKSGSSCGFNHYLLTIGGILCLFRAFFYAIYYVRFYQCG